MSQYSGKLKVSEGDWICAKEECQNLNFARRDKCNKCGEPKDDGNQIVKNSGSEIGSKFAEKSKGLFSANDWQCGKCGNINWARRSTCNVCNAPKIGPEETRTGYGGGFKENENITYKEREDSDGEFDEFGRKKKKYRGKVPVVPSRVVTPPPQNDYDEEEDDDDDEDVDLSKYALSDSDDDGPPPAPKILKRKSPSNSPRGQRGRSYSRGSRSSSSSSSSSRSRSPPPQNRRHFTEQRRRSRSPQRRSRSPYSNKRRSREPSPTYRRRSRSRSPIRRR